MMVPYIAGELNVRPGPVAEMFSALNEYDRFPMSVEKRREGVKVLSELIPAIRRGSRDKGMKFLVFFGPILYSVINGLFSRSGNEDSYAWVLGDELFDYFESNLPGAVQVHGTEERAKARMLEELMSNPKELSRLLRNTIPSFMKVSTEPMKGRRAELFVRAMTHGDTLSKQIGDGPYVANVSTDLFGPKQRRLVNDLALGAMKKMIGLP